MNQERDVDMAECSTSNQYLVETVGVDDLNERGSIGSGSVRHDVERLGGVRDQCLSTALYHTIPTIPARRMSWLWLWMIFVFVDMWTCVDDDVTVTTTTDGRWRQNSRQIFGFGEDFPAESFAK